jgi:hypothetical protein
MSGPRLVRKSPTKTQATPESASQAQIATRAYALYEQDGCVHGRDIDHWLKAESELGHADTSAPVRRAPAARTKRSPGVSA